jgi:hypothetical protein
MLNGFILVWFIFSNNQIVSSGVEPFKSLQACTDARDWIAHVIPLQDSFASQCFEDAPLNTLTSK